ncbi:sensor histidine kinase [Paenibacillus mucilaginosus]|uniref:Signal transduction histidine kinase, LytS n=1 Tax=Paenibacillus mucilaginosus (strain KNP414) TaxID=1036673 RepID=F8F553_PAEMK|nr:histidine kinase [Paenibacillus mucilaginosus]AEI40783.1 signal transduction histidine kinase, LytS [Paenibacillus mucilaginosus KNP414]MCG7211742.1 histidine kinase [Paenibacillus mucilaginosus]WDM29904.1 histidine kinase [Paenibacillus mucilaginosus]
MIQLKRLLHILGSRSIVAKLMAAFLLVVLPLCICSIWITYNSSKQMQQEIERANESKLHFYYSHLEFELNRITALVTEYAFDETLSTFSTRIPIMSPYEKAANLNWIHTKLKQIRETSPYIGDVVYYVPRIGKRVSAQEGITDVPAEQWQGLIYSMGNLKGALSQYGGELYMLRSNPFNIDRETPPDFLLGVRLSSAELERRLKEFAVSGESDITLLFGRGSDYVVSSSSDYQSLGLGEERAQEPAVKVQQRRTEEYLHYTIFDRDNHFRLTASIPNDVVMRPIQVYSQWLLLLSAGSVVIVIFFSFWIYRTLHRPLTVLVKGFKKAEQGDMKVKLNPSRQDEFGYLYARFNEMMEHLHALIEENYIQRIRTGEAELKHLQSQITPHFLYNSLFSIKQMAELENVELIKEFSDYLGQYFRYMTRDAAAEVSLGQEVDHALVYLAIQRIRFGSRLRAEVEELPAEYRSIRVPRVLLQPLIENVFEHGLRQKHSDGLLRLSYAREESGLVIRVEDNGDGLGGDMIEELSRRLGGTGPAEGERTGLLNVNERLRIRFGPGYGIRVERSRLGGLSVCLHLPAEGEMESCAAC